MIKGIIHIYLKLKTLLAPYCRRKRQRNRRNVGKVMLYYRICDQGYQKVKEHYITKECCLANAVAQFPPSKVSWQVVADNVCDETYDMIRKYIPQNLIKRVSVGHGAGTFRMVYEDAVRQADDTLIYFLEDDYLHLPQSLQQLTEAAKDNRADYFTLYDHPDKYATDSPNPLVSGGSEKTRVFCTKGWHWKVTNSTTMTFAAFADTLRRDKKTFWRWTETKHPYDFQIFLELRLFAHRTLLSPIPTLSTHGDSDMLAPGVDWEKTAADVAQESL